MQIDKVEFIANTQPLDSVFKLNPIILRFLTAAKKEQKAALKFIDIEGTMVRVLTTHYL